MSLYDVTENKPHEEHLESLLATAELVYPKPLKPLELDAPFSGLFLPIERATLRSAWRLVVPMQRQLFRNVYYNFLTHHADQINKFRFDIRQNRIDLEALHRHAKHMVTLTGELILKYLDRPHELHSKLEESMPIHVKCQVDSLYVSALAESVKSALLESDVLARHSSATLEDALSKLFDMIGHFNASEVVRRRTVSTKYSIVQHKLGPKIGESMSTTRMSVRSEKATPRRLSVFDV